MSGDQLREPADSILIVELALMSQPRHMDMCLYLSGTGIGNVTDTTNYTIAPPSQNNKFRPRNFNGLK